MASLNSLIVNGASRFLNKAYFNEIVVLDDATFEDITANGDVTAESLYANDLHLENGGGWYMTDSYYIRNYNGKAILISSPSTANLSEPDHPGIYLGTLATYYFKENGSLKARDINANSNTTGVLNTGEAYVTNTLHAKRYDLQSINQAGGSWYISPTIIFPNDGTSLTVERSGDDLVLTIIDLGITSTSMAGIVWSADSLVKVSGEIGGIVTGTMDGKVVSINTTTNTLVLKVKGENSGNVNPGSYSSTQFSDLSVMLYQRRAVVGQETNDFRVGIWMNCYDDENDSATIRIYGGSSSTPNVLLGNMKDVTLPQGVSLDGYGLFADNAFLKGTIYSTSGQIGGWVISSNCLYHYSDTPGEYAIVFNPSGTNNVPGSIGGVTNKSWIFTVKDKFGIDTNGYLYSIGGKIAGWTISETSLTNGTLGSSGISFYTANQSSSVDFAGRGSATNTWRIGIGSKFGITDDGSTYCSYIKAIGGLIGGWTIDSSYLGIGTIGQSNSAFLYPGGVTATIAGASRSNLVITAGANFGVTRDGALYCSNATLTGSIKQSNNAWYFNSDGSAKIGALTLTSAGVLSVPAANISGKITAAQINVSSLSAISADLGSITAGSINIGSGKFTVTSAGVLTATGASISGTLTAGAGSSIGPWVITATSIYKTNSAWGSSATGAAYFGNDGLSITDKFKVSSAGALTATGATITGTITATGGKIGNFTIQSDGSLDGTWTGNKSILIDPNLGIIIANGNNMTTVDPYHIEASGYITAGYITTSGRGVSWIQGGKGQNAAIRITSSGGGGYNPLCSIKTDAGTWSQGPVYESYYLAYQLNSRTENGNDAQYKFGDDGIFSCPAISSAGIISTGEVKSKSANAFRLIQGNYGVILRNDGDRFYILLTASGSAENGSWNSLRPFAIRLSDGFVFMENGVGVGGNIVPTTSGSGSVGLSNQYWNYIAGSQVWGSKVVLSDNWVGYYSTGFGGTRYGYIQCNADRMYFVKQNSTIGLSEYFNFNARVYAPAMSVAYTNTTYALSCSSFICNSWIRTKGDTGWFSEDHGGGWYMTDNNWIRSYNNKSVYVNTGDLRCDGSTWGGKVRLTENWIGFYKDNGSTGTKYGFIQCNADRMYFRKENSTANQVYYYDFDNCVYLKGVNGTGAYAVGCLTDDKKRVNVISSGSSTNNFSVHGQWGGTSYSWKHFAPTSSDIRLKTNIGDSEIDSALDMINQIQIHSFDWTDHEEHQKIGFIADELEELDSKLAIGGGYADDGTMDTKGVNTFYLDGYIVKALQEEDEKVEILQTKVTNLEEENNKLLNRIVRLEAMLEYDRGKV